MTWLKDTALAGIRWGWEGFVAFVKWTWAKTVLIGETVYDPPPHTIKVFFFSALGIAVSCWITFAFANSWFYKPTVQYLTSFSWTQDEGDVELPSLPAFVPTPAIVVTALPPPAVVCHDASDTPHCEPVQESAEKYTQGTQIEDGSNSIPVPVAKPKATVKKRLTVRRVKHQPFQTYWGF